jgi:hypothetical protein
MYELLNSRGRALFSLLVFGLISPCFGQFESGAVLGTVTDPNSSVVMQARVGLENIDTGVVRDSISDSNGTY